ncbi:MAG: translation initiation factor IF-2 [Candidatus Magasanikbacteria bacterium RIFOXYD2_FULL_39_9]|uniref:Translation initiation factor IF-2 n=1 Tax=Candidatus Magasanikbacteria bacterium RIFOXYD1_FULL_40_23 TaxID=1798705 RepID=A0A1F6PA00_9BACT|nr:MAG: translation initiation factor IF-2 [Candidatus Magasanikbacteria bacterium RIFOXYD2_FULL_39_9]OGH92783.1 MAG: translation initiation factor IF-2 [Candidatus Magasanikbacteria bacterium RIFOXYD1_FULL_40_23]
MNVSELARQLRIHPQKLLQILPEFGFDIGAKAIKIDDRIAQQIQRQWKRIKFVMEEREMQEKEKQKELEKEARKSSGVTVNIADKLTVRELAELLQMPVTRLIMEFMKNGILATQNENIDRDTAVLVAQELGFTVAEGSGETTVVEETSHVENLQSILTEEGGVARPPVIVVMGHVDHGKTKLLDSIRSANVMAQEAGGITQHIGAYQVVWNNPKTKEKSPLTFIDTPGHEAFSVMRGRGAKVADIAVLVVAADDSVKPQTIEAINIIKAVKLPVVVAINKMDKEGADPKKVRADLSQHNILAEEWGGDVPMVEISAKNNLNIDKLLDILLLVADVHADEIKANPGRAAAGTIIEAHVDKGEGPVATVLVQTGTLKLNDPLVVNGEIYGKVRAMRDYKGENLKEAVPSCPVRILGFKVAPQVGDILDVGSAGTANLINIKEKRNIQSGAEKKVVSRTADPEEEEQKKVLNLVIKADTLGSLEAIIGSLDKIKNDEVGVRVVGKGLGNVSADDVSKAETTHAVICGFNVTPVLLAKNMIQDKNIQFLEFSVIYDLMDFVKVELKKLLNPEKIVIELGSLRVAAIFRTTKNSMIVGGRVESGKIKKDARARVRRNGEIIGTGKLAQLQSGKQTVNELPEGNEGGLQFDGKLKLEVGDVLEAYKEEEKEKKLILG